MTAARRHTGRAAGTILIVTMWITMGLAALVLMLAQAMRVELVGSANEYSSLQAQAVEQGAVQYVLSNVDSLQGRMPADADMPCEAVRVGAGAFWIIRPDFDDDHAYAYGVVDEASKVNLNTASPAMLSKLPDMTEELATCLIDWRDSDSTISSGGAESEYYLLLPDPYQCKNAPLETVEELFLVKGAAGAIIFGEDANRNAVLDPNEDDADVSGPPDNRDGRLDRGLFPFVTVYSIEPNTDADGKRRVNVNDRQGLANLLSKNLSASQATPIMTRIARAGQFRNVMDFYVRARLTADEFAKVADQLTASAQANLTGLINVNTAPLEVLACLPGLADTDAASLVAKRAESGVNLDNIAWVTAALTPEKLVPIGDLITTRSCRFSADIVSVSGDGRAFRRCRIVVDARSSPSKVIYRQDLTHLGWPLAPEIISQLRSGVSLDQYVPAQTTRQEVAR